MFGLIKIMCEVLDQQQVGTKFDSMTKEASDAQESRTNSINTSNVGATNNCLNTPDYFSTNYLPQTGKKIRE